MSSLKKNSCIFFLVPYPAGSAPGQRFRFEQYIPILREQGFEVREFAFLSTQTNDILYQRGKILNKLFGVFAGYWRRLWMLTKVHSATHVFVFRECAPLGPPVFEWMLCKLFKKKVIYDFDDAIWLPNTSPENQLVSWLKWHGKVRSICRWSYRVSCGNEYLAAFARDFNESVIVNPTTIDTEGLHNPAHCQKTPTRETITVGWTGSHSTLHYLDSLVPVFRSLSKSHPQFRLLLIADREPQWTFPGLQFIRWNKATEIEDLMKIDIGIMPLTDDAWSRGKCGFKALQYMSLEKPALVSPVGVNTKIVEHDVQGFLCNTPDDWLKYLERLIQQPQEIARLGKAGREKVISQYSVISNTGNFLSLLK